MDMYRFVAVCENDSTSKQLTYTPENFEGVKINREFSFVPPYGFTPKFAVDTMRVIKDDAAFFTAKNVAFGYFLKMKLYVSKLNADGMTYSPLMTLVVNSETLSQTKDYIEFSVDVVNSSQNYFNTKSTPKKIPLTTYKSIPKTFYKINNVNLTAILEGSLDLGLVSFSKSNNKINIIHDDDLSLYEVGGYDSKYVIYQCVNGGTASVNINTAIIVDIFMSIGETPSGQVKVSCDLRSSSGVFKTEVWSSSRQITNIGQRFEFIYNEIKNVTFAAGDFLTFSISRVNVPSYVNVSLAQNNTAFTIKKITTITYPNKSIKSILLGDLFENLFGSIDYLDLKINNTDIFISSDAEVVNNTGTLTATPQDLVREISAMFGLVFNFGDEHTKIKKMDEYFTELYNSTRIVLNKYKDLQISNFETVYNSATIGVPKNETEEVIYMTPQQTKNTWRRYTYNENTYIGEFVDSFGDNFEIVCNKLSPDTEKVINRINAAATGNGQASNSNLYVVPLRNGTYCDMVSPLDMAKNNSPILALFFSHLEFVTDYIDYFLGLYENENLTPILEDEWLGYREWAYQKKLRPIVYEFTALLGEADFSEHFAEMVDFNGDTVDLFVYSSETTDKLGEIKCKGLVFK